MNGCKKVNGREDEGEDEWKRRERIIILGFL